MAIRSALYAALRARQPVAHGGVAALGDGVVLSVSPELWVEVEGGRATTRPMKGTSAGARILRRRLGAEGLAGRSQAAAPRT